MRPGALRLGRYFGEEVSGVNCQESTSEELIESLRDALGEALEFNRANVRFWIGARHSPVPTDCPLRAEFRLRESIAPAGVHARGWLASFSRSNLIRWAASMFSANQKCTTRIENVFASSVLMPGDLFREAVNRQGAFAHSSMA